MSKEKQIDYKAYARQMRENCVRDHNGTEPIVICSLELWEEIATIIERFGKQSGWISVDEKSPDEEKAYIIVTDGETVIVARRAWLYRSNSDGRLRCPANYGNGMYITHWMPLPKPPKMRKEDEGK